MTDARITNLDMLNRLGVLALDEMPQRQMPEIGDLMTDV